MPPNLLICDQQGRNNSRDIRLKKSRPLLLPVSSQFIWVLCTLEVQVDLAILCYFRHENAGTILCPTNYLPKLVLNISCIRKIAIEKNSENILCCIFSAMVIIVCYLQAFSFYFYSILFITILLDIVMNSALGVTSVNNKTLLDKLI